MPLHAPHRGRIALLATVVLLTPLFAAVPDASAHGSTTRVGRAISPTPVGGRAWSVPVIRLYDTTPRLYREGIDIAIRSWNDTRVGVRFARTTNRRTAHVVIGTASYPGMVSGKATLGQVRGAWLRLDRSLIATEHIQSGNTIFDLAGGAVPEDIAEVTAHELGHVLGLVHTRGCSLMTVTNVNTCRYRPPSGMWACRLQQRRDVLALARRYRGTGVVRPRAYCPLSATAAGRVGTITTTASSRDQATSLRWRETTNTYGYVVARSANGGPCPTTPDGSALKRTTSNARYTDGWGESTPMLDARYCYAVWSRNGRGRLTGPSRVVVDVRRPVVAPISALQATASGDTVQFAWTQPAGTTSVRLYRYAPTGSCTLPNFTPEVQVFGGATTGTDYYVPSGTWTYAAIRGDDPSDDEPTDWRPQWHSDPVCVDVTVP